MSERPNKKRPTETMPIDKVFKPDQKLIVLKYNGCKTPISKKIAEQIQGTGQTNSDKKSEVEIKNHRTKYKNSKNRNVYF